MHKQFKVVKRNSYKTIPAYFSRKHIPYYQRQGKEIQSLMCSKQACSFSFARSLSQISLEGEGRATRGIPQEKSKNQSQCLEDKNQACQSMAGLMLIT